MNIGIVTAWYESGAGHVSKNYERALEKDHRVFIYARGGNLPAKVSEWNRPNVTRAPPHSCSTGLHRRHFNRWIKRCLIEGIIFNEQRHWAGVILARKLGLLVGGYVDYYTADTVPFYDLYDFLICNTKRHYNVFKQHPQSCYCPWGTKLDLYKPLEKRINRPITFITSAGWVGTHAKSLPWMDRRGTGMAIRAFRRVEGDCRLIVYSQVSLAECPDEWQTAVNRDARIEFRVGTFAPFPYTEGDVYIYPSRLDGIGLTLPEALSCGLSAITTNSPPMNEFVHDGENGILVNVAEYRGRPDGYYWPEAICDEDHLTEVINKYVCNPEIARSYGTIARNIAEKELSWEKNSFFLSKWVTIQKKLINRPGVNLEDICIKANKYDSNYNPTTLQKLISSGNNLVAVVKKRIQGI